MSEPVVWRQSSRCANGACVQVSAGGEQVHIRRSTDPDGPRLVFDRDGWRAFVDGVKRGEFDR